MKIGIKSSYVKYLYSYRLLLRRYSGAWLQQGLHTVQPWGHFTKVRALYH